jgi:hypothetical protein
VRHLQKTLQTRIIFIAFFRAISFFLSAAIPLKINARPEMQANPQHETHAQPPYDPGTPSAPEASAAS